MISLPISKGASVLLDEGDYDLVSKYSWHLHTGGYAMANIWNKKLKKYEHTYMHRYILGAKKGQEVDHVNCDKLDNRRCNIRLCTRSQNIVRTSAYRTRKSGYVGVWTDERRGSIHARIKKAGKTIHLGTFSTLLEAAKARNVKALELFGNFAYLNPV